MSFTFDTSHALMSSLKVAVPRNIPDISVTAPVFHEPMFWSKKPEFANMSFIVVTRRVFHEAMS